LLPQVIRRAEVGWKKQRFVRPGRKTDNDELEKLRRRAPRPAQLLDAISKLAAPVRAAEPLRQTSLDNQTLRALVKRGLAELREEAVVRDPHADEQFVATSNLVLNEEQTLAVKEITDALDSPENARPILLHGVTGSGKTEVYLQAIQAALDRGRIVDDEEQETTYKKEEARPNEAGDVAVGRAKIEKCAVVAGRAPPSLESYHNATIGKYRLVTLTQRIDEKQMPLMRIIDLRHERRKEKKAAILSEKLSQAIADRLEKREQTILYMNCLGFFTSLLCSNCGEACNCTNS